jgi:hypothetical protein
MMAGSSAVGLPHVKRGSLEHRAKAAQGWRRTRGSAAGPALQRGGSAGWRASPIVIGSELSRARHRWRVAGTTARYRRCRVVARCASGSAGRARLQHRAETLYQPDGGLDQAPAGGRVRAGDRYLRPAAAKGASAPDAHPSIIPRSIIGWPIWTAGVRWVIWSCGTWLRVYGRWRAAYSAFNTGITSVAIFSNIGNCSSRLG